MLKNTSRAQKYVNKGEIRRQLYLVYFFTGILPILILGIYLVLNTRNMVLNQHSSQVSADNVRVRSIMLDLTINMSNISDDIFSDKQLQGILRGEYKTREDAYAACRAYTKLNKYATTNTEISTLNVYYDNDSMYDYGHFMRVSQDIKQTDWYQKAMSSWGYHWMTVITYDMGGNKRHELGLIRKIQVDGTNRFAVLFMSINKDYLKSKINTSSLVNEISVNDNSVFYTLDNNMGKPLGIQVDLKDRYYQYAGIDAYNGLEALVEVSSLPPIKSQDSLYIATIDYSAIHNMNRITWTSGAIVVISLFVPLLMVSVFSSTFSARIKTLRQEMHKVSLGQLDIIKEFKGNDELADLYTDLKRMIESIKSRDEEIYNERISRQKLMTHQQEMKYEMLASQINPHFLFNTLETIRMKAFGVGDLEVANAIKLLGKSMRHVLDTSGRLTSLKSELDHIAIYLDIQKLRFRDKINYDIQVGEGIDPEAYKILPLLLQPVVENAFIHGLENKEVGGYIQIEIGRQGEQLVVMVADNGDGMTEEQLTELLRRMRAEQSDDSHKSIGLYNIDQRIRLYYGESFGLDITSTRHIGTQVRIHLPLSYDHEAISKVDEVG